MLKSDWVFICRKCKHQLFVKKKSMIKLMGSNCPDCPNCGVEGDELWIFSRLGNWEEEKGNYNK